MPDSSDFRSPYRHGFARVAACTLRTVIADPAANAEAVLAQARECADEGVGLVRLPGAAPDRLLDRRPAPAGHAARRGRGRARRRSSPASADLLPVLVVGAPAAARQPDLQLRGRRSTAAGSSASRRSRTCRTTASSTSAASSRPATTCAATIRVARRRGAVRARPALRRRRRARPRRCTSRSARTCGCRCRRAPRRRWPARPCWPTCPAARSPSAGRRTARPAGPQSRVVRCLAAYVYAAAGAGRVDDRPVLGRPDHDLRERRRCSAETERFPDGPAALGRRRRPRPAARRSGCGRAPSTTTAAPHAARTDGVPDRRVPARPARRRPRAAAQGRALPVRAGRPGAAGAGLLRGLQHPGLRPGAAAARDRAAQGRHRRLRRARLDPRADRRRARRWTALGRPRSDILGLHACRASPPATRTKAQRHCG